jgi:SAM-dependent methyltransferase
VPQPMCRPWLTRDGWGDVRAYGLDHYGRPEVASAYHSDRYGGPAGQWLIRWENRLYRALVPGCSSLLDLGSGTGKLLATLYDKAPVRVGADGSLPMLREARRRGVRAALVVANACSLPFRTGAVSWAVSSRVILHLMNWEPAVAEMCRITRTGVVVDVPTMTSLAPLDALGRRILGLSQPYRVFRLRAVKRCFRAYGFALEKASREFFFPVRLHRFLCNPPLSERLEKAARSLGLTAVWGGPMVIQFRREVVPWTAEGNSRHR